MLRPGGTDIGPEVLRIPGQPGKGLLKLARPAIPFISGVGYGNRQNMHMAILLL